MPKRVCRRPYSARFSAKISIRFLTRHIYSTVYNGGSLQMYEVKPSKAWKFSKFSAQSIKSSTYLICCERHRSTGRISFWGGFAAGCLSDRYETLSIQRIEMEQQKIDYQKLIVAISWRVCECCAIPQTGLNCRFQKVSSARRVEFFQIVATKTKLCQIQLIQKHWSINL